jgi:hypothetical protein
LLVSQDGRFAHRAQYPTAADERTASIPAADLTDAGMRTAFASLPGKSRVRTLLPQHASLAPHFSRKRSVRRVLTSSTTRGMREETDYSRAIRSDGDARRRRSGVVRIGGDLSAPRRPASRRLALRPRPTNAPIPESGSCC